MTLEEINEKFGVVERGYTNSNKNTTTKSKKKTLSEINAEFGIDNVYDIPKKDIIPKRTNTLSEFKPSVKSTQNNTNSLGVNFEGRYKPSAPVTSNFINQVGALPTKFDTDSAQKQYDNNLQEIANLYAKAQKENASSNYNVSEFGRYGDEIDRLIAQNKEIEKNIQNKPDIISNEKKAELENDILFLNNGVVFLSDVEKNILKYSDNEAYARANGKNTEAYNTLKILSDLDNSYLSEYAGALLEQIDYNANKKNENKTVSGNTREEFNNAVKQEFKKPFASKETKTAIGAGLESLPRSLIQVGGAIADAFGTKATESEGYKKAIDYFSSWQSENAKNKELSKNYYNSLANEGKISKAGAKARQFVDDASKLAIEGTMQSAPYVVLGFLSGGTSTATTAALQASANATKIQQISQAATNLVKNPGYWLSFTQQFGNDYFEAKENGANDYQAAASSLLSAAVNAGLEMGFGIQANADDVLKSQSFKEFASEWVESMLEEGTEEITQGAFSNFVDKIIWDSDKKLASLNSEEDAVLNVPKMWEEFKGGFIGSFLLSGAQMINSLNVNKSKLRSLAEVYTKEDFSNWLESKGSKNFETESDVLAKALTGKYITEKEASIIFNSKEAFSLLEEMTTAKFAVDSKNKNATAKGVQKVLNQISDYAIGIPLRNNTENNVQNTRALMPSGTSDSGLNVTNEINRNVSPALTQPSVANIDNTAVSEKNQRLRPAEAQIIGADGRGETVAVNLFKDVDKGEVYVSNGETKTLGEVAFTDDAQRDLYFAARQRDYDTETANAMLDGYSDTPGYAEAFDYFYNRGVTGESFDFEGSAHSTQINSIVAQRAFALGRQILEQNRTSAIVRQNSRTIKEAEDGVYFSRDYSTKREKELSNKQKSQLKLIEEYANEHKVRVSVVASLGGRRNAEYDPKTDTITISLDARANAYVGFFSHELLHRIKAQDIDSYHELLDEIINNYLSKDPKFDLEGRIREIQALYKKEAKQELSREEAIEEIVANSVIPALSSRQFVESIAKNKKTLAEKISEWIDELINELNKILDRLSNIAEVREVRKDVQLLENIRNIINESVSKTGGIREEKGETSIQMLSLDDVDPVEPTNNSWKRTITFAELKTIHPDLYDVTADEQEIRNPTQISSTVSTYRKIYNILKGDNFKGTILDASSGLGYGTRAGIEEYGFEVDDIEPYPDKNYQPKYTDYSKLNKKYDVIISNAVLNVVPQDTRDALVVKMGSLLKEGGRMFINVRGKDVDTLANNKNNDKLGNMEWYVASTGSYQKGFTKSELKAYLEDALGDDFVVKPTNEFGGVSVTVEKKKSRLLEDMSQVIVLYPEKIKSATDNIGTFDSTNPDIRYSINESKYWKPKLTKAEWNLLNYTKKKEVETSDKYIDNETKWLYTTSKGVSVFAIYSSSEDHLDDPTVLYAVGGKTASIRLRDMEELINGKGPVKKISTRWIELLSNNVKGKIKRLYNDRRKRANGRYDSVFSSESSNGNRRRDSERSGENIREEKAALLNTLNNGKFSIDEPESEIAQLKDDLKAAQIREENLSSTISTQQQIIKSLKAEFEITKGHILNRNKIEALSKRILNKYSSSYDSAKLSDNLQKLFDYIANDKNVDWYSVMDVSTAIAKEIISKSTRTNRDLYNQYADMREYFRTTKFNIPEEIRAEVGEYYGGWNNFRRQNFGRFNLTNEGYSLDSYWNEISEMYPEFFDVEATPQEQVMQVVEALESVQPYAENPFKLNMDEYAYDLALSIYDEYFNIPEVKTFADKQAQKLEQQRAKLATRWHREKERIKTKNEKTIAELKAANNAKIQKLTEKYNKAQGETKQYYRDMIARLRDKSNERLIRQKAVLTEQKSKEVQRVRDLREAEKIKTGIRKIMLDFSSKLLANTDKKHIKKEFVSDIVEACELVLGKYNNKQMRDKLRAIQLQYAALKTDDGLNLTDYTDIVVEDIARLNAILEDKTINVLNMDELRETYDVLKEIRHTLVEANRAFATEKREKIEELGGAVSSELRKEKYKEQIASKTLDSFKRFSWSNAIPIYAFKHIGSKTFEQLYENMRKGEDVYAVDMQEAKEVVKAASQTYKKTSWDMEKSEKFKTVYGDEITFNLGQKMSIYALSKREQAMKHLLEGGITFEDPATTKKGLIKYKSNNPVSTPLTATDIANIINSLTEQQRAYVDVMQKYLSTELSAKGNEVTNVLYGIDRFNEKNYFPIKSNRMFIDFNVEKSSRDSTIKNAAFTKGTVKNANNAVVIGDFDSVWGKHVVDMSLYHGLTLPLEDFKRVYNYKESVNTSVKTLLNASFGESAGQYIETLLKDINGGVQVSQTERFAKALTALRKSSAVAASLSVAIQQPSSIVRATAIIDPKYFITKPTKQSYDELLKYAPIARVKEMGYFDMSIGKSATDWLITNEGETLKEKVDLAFRDKKALKGQIDDLWFALPGMADRLTWTQIWEACKREQFAKGNLRYGSEEHLKAAAKRFTEVIELTQVYDSVFARNELMRSKSVFTQAFTSFMAEPSVTLNMAVYGVSQFKNNKAYTARVAASLIGSIIANAILKSFVTAARDEDEENNYWEVYTADVLNNVFDDMNALNYIPIARDLWSLVQGYDVSRPDTELIGELIESITNASKKISKGEAEAKDYIEAINNVLALFGIPTKNITRDISSFFNVIDKVKTGEEVSKAGVTEEIFKGNALLKVLSKFGFNTQLNVGWLYTSMIFDKDKSQTEFIRELLRESGKTDEQIDKGLKELLTADTDVHKYAERYADGDIEALTEAVEYYGGLGFNEKDIASAIRSYVDKTINGEERATTTTAAGTIYQYSDLYSAIDRNDTKDVKTISQALLLGYMDSGKTAKEAKSLVKSRLTATYKEKYIKASGSERRKIREALYSTLAYDSYEALDKVLKGWIE